MFSHHHTEWWLGQWRPEPPTGRPTNNVAAIQSLTRMWMGVENGLNAFLMSSSLMSISPRQFSSHEGSTRSLCRIQGCSYGRRGRGEGEGGGGRGGGRRGEVGRGGSSHLFTTGGKQYMSCLNPKCPSSHPDLKDGNSLVRILLHQSD